MPNILYWAEWEFIQENQGTFWLLLTREQGNQRLQIPEAPVETARGYHNCEERETTGSVSTEMVDEVAYNRRAVIPLLLQHQRLREPAS